MKKSDLNKKEMETYVSYKAAAHNLGVTDVLEAESLAESMRGGALRYMTYSIIAAGVIAALTIVGNLATNGFPIISTPIAIFCFFSARKKLKLMNTTIPKVAKIYIEEELNQVAI